MVKPRGFRTSGFFFIDCAVTFTLGPWCCVLGRIPDKKTAASSQEVVEGGHDIFFKRIRSWELNQAGF